MDSESTQVIHGLIHCSSHTDWTIKRWGRDGGNMILEVRSTFWDPTPFLCLFLLPGCPQVNSFLPPKPSAKAPDLTTMEPASRGLEALRLLTKINYSSVKLCFSGTLPQRQKEMTNKSVQAEIVGLGNTPLKPEKLSSDLSRSYRQRE